MNSLFPKSNNVRGLPVHHSPDTKMSLKVKSEPNPADFLENTPSFAFDKIVGKLESPKALGSMACLSSLIREKVAESTPVVYLQSLLKQSKEIFKNYQDGQIKAFFTQAENSCFSPIKMLNFLEKLPWPSDLALGLEDTMFLSDYLNPALLRQVCFNETVKSTLTYRNIEFLLKETRPCPPALVNYTDGQLETYLRADQPDLRLLKILLAKKSNFCLVYKELKMGPQDLFFICSLISHASSLEINFSEEVHDEHLVALSNLMQLTKLEINGGSISYFSPSFLSSKNLNKLFLKKTQNCLDASKLPEKQGILIKHEKLGELHLEYMNNLNIPTTTHFPNLHTLLLGHITSVLDGLLFLENSHGIKSLSIADCQNIQQFPQGNFNALNALAIGSSSFSFKNFDNFLKNAKNIDKKECKNFKNKNIDSQL